jgi:hypothetical protein
MYISVRIDEKSTAKDWEPGGKKELAAHIDCWFHTVHRECIERMPLVFGGAGEKSSGICDADIRMLCRAYVRV